MNENIKYLEESVSKLKSIDKLINGVLSEEEEKSGLQKYIVEPVAKVWSFLVNKVKTLIHNIISRTLSLMKFPGDSVVIVIPAQEKPSISNALNEGALQSIKGNYNEALTCKYLVDHNKVPIKITILTEDVSDNGVVVVDLNNEGKKEITNIQSVVDKWDLQLKQAAKDKYNDLFKIIDMGSRDMTRYIMETTLKEDGLITAVKIKNTAFLEDSGFKGDMELTIEKAGREIIKKYSLKLYGGTSANLWNPTVLSMVTDLLGQDKKKDVQLAFARDKDFSDNIKLAKQAAEEKKAAEKVLKNKGDRIDDVLKMIKFKFSDKFKTELKISKNKNTLEQLISNKRDERGIYREKLNPISAKIAYKFISKRFNDPLYKKDIVSILLQRIGFSDKDTNFLMAVIGKAQLKSGESKLLDRHPELDLYNYKLVYVGGTTMRFVDSTGKTMLTIGVKEGEKKQSFSLVSFAGIEPYKFSGEK